MAAGTSASLCMTLLSVVLSVSAEIEGVVWKTVGEEITIQCRSQNAPEYLHLKMGLSKEVDIFVTGNHSKKITVSERFYERLVPNGDLPNVDILIKNLTSKDTGPYWCVYKKFNKETQELREVEGSGSVLLVVTDAVPGCDSSHQKLVLVSAVIAAAAVLLGVVMGVLIWIILKTKTKPSRTTVKPRHVTTNDADEEMRGTLRR